MNAWRRYIGALKTNRRLRRSWQRVMAAACSVMLLGTLLVLSNQAFTLGNRDAVEQVGIVLSDGGAGDSANADQAAADDAAQGASSLVAAPLPPAAQEEAAASAEAPIDLLSAIDAVSDWMDVRTAADGLADAVLSDGFEASDFPDADFSPKASLARSDDWDCGGRLSLRQCVDKPGLLHGRRYCCRGAGHRGPLQRIRLRLQRRPEHNRCHARRVGLRIAWHACGRHRRRACQQRQGCGGRFLQCVHRAREGVQLVRQHVHECANERLRLRHRAEEGGPERAGDKPQPGRRAPDHLLRSPAFRTAW